MAGTTRGEAIVGVDHNQNQDMLTAVMGTRIPLEVAATMVAKLVTIVEKKGTSKGIATSG